MDDNKIFYALVAIPTSEGDYSVNKNVLITWVGSETKPLEKARSSQHRVWLYNFIKKTLQLAGEVQALTREEMTKAIILEKMTGTSVARDHDHKQEELRRAAELDLLKKQNAQAKGRSPSTIESVAGGSSFNWVDEAPVTTALVELRDYVNKTDWVLFGYGDGPHDIKLVGSGSGGLSQLLENFGDSACVFAVLSYMTSAGDYSTVKYIFINWIGPNVKPPVKARSSQHRVTLYNYVNKIVPLSGELQAFTKEDVSDSAIAQKLIGTRVLGQGEGIGNRREGSGPSGTMNFQFADEALAKSEVEAARKAEQPGYWILFGYDEKSNMYIQGKGTNGIQDIESQLPEDDIKYILLAQNVVDSGYSTIKFVLITWVGPACKPLLKARSSQNRSQLYSFINNYLQLGGEMQALTKEDLTESNILVSGLRALGAVTGASSSVAAKKGGSLEFVFANEEQVQKALEDIRNDNSATNWIVLGYDSGREDALVLVGSGSGGIADLQSLLLDDQVSYAVLTVELVEGDYTVKKYIFLTWVGPSVKPLFKARSSQHRNQLYKFVNKTLQLGGEYPALTREDLSEDLLKEKITGARKQDEAKIARAVPTKTADKPAARTNTPTEEPKLPITNEAEAVESLIAVRKQELNWLHFGYTGGRLDTITLVNKGTGNFTELYNLLEPEAISYFVIGQETKEGDYSVRKFVFLAWVGPQVKPLLKARSSQHRIMIYNFCNTHVSLSGELQILQKEELTEDLLLYKLTGTRVKADN
eukprot:TRINITY_DN934_c0_g1_i1.p1 TRINITY_DN934_c0_g1~~TRINITY_DN934_c0_g1_i1.p1  ORF type:complete len:832 (-),score=254.53 TRINITY_DN934_c0_g1_i1:188-2461(-)